MRRWLAGLLGVALIVLVSHRIAYPILAVSIPNFFRGFWDAFQGILWLFGIIRQVTPLAGDQNSLSRIMGFLFGLAVDIGLVLSFMSLVGNLFSYAFGASDEPSNETFEEDIIEDSWMPEQEDVQEFHETFDLPIETFPTIPDDKTKELRVRLIQEETEELIEAFAAADIVGTADALADLLYVTLGCAVSCGINIHPIFQEVHRSNMTKVGGHKDAGGKWIKPPSYEPPDIEPLLERQKFNGYGGR